MKKRPATITDRERKKARESKQAVNTAFKKKKNVCYLHETNFHDDFILHYHLG